MISVVVQAALCSVCYMFHQASILAYLSEVRKARRATLSLRRHRS